MATFAVIARANQEAVKEAITKQYGENLYEFSPNSWFIIDAGTTKNVMDKLKITGGALGGAHAVILRVSAYAGFGPQAAWTWLQKNSDAVVHD